MKKYFRIAISYNNTALQILILANLYKEQKGKEQKQLYFVPLFTILYAKMRPQTNRIQMAEILGGK